MSGLEPEWWYRQIGGLHRFGCECVMCRPIDLTAGARLVEEAKALYAQYAPLAEGVDSAGWPLRDGP